MTVERGGYSDCVGEVDSDLLVYSFFPVVNVFTVNVVIILLFSKMVKPDI